MTLKNKLSNCFKIFGLVYFIIHCIVFVATTIMMIYMAIKAPEIWSVFILLVFPLLGVFAGHWIHIGRYSWWRIILIVLSLLLFSASVFIVIVLGPELKDLETRQVGEPYKGGEGLNAMKEKFFIAVYSSDIDTIQECLDNRLDVNVRNETGQTALHVAQNKEILEMLIARGADVNAFDDMHMTPMFNKEVALTKILVENGADINMKSDKGNTPLMWYCYSGYLDGIKYMVSQGADVNEKNVDGQTAYDIAEHFHPELLEYLEAIGAKPGK